MNPECTEEVQENAAETARRVSALVGDYLKRWVSSGFRTSSVNAKTPGASKKSNHMRALAVDLETLGYFLKKDYSVNGEKSLLVLHDLYLEDPDYTKGWTHLQIVPPASGKRVFIPA
jgi:hypothetical protein